MITITKCIFHTKIYLFNFMAMHACFHPFPSCVVSYVSREGSVKAEMEFLETLDIAGVSQHSLLFSKTAPVTVDLDDEDVRK